MTNPIWCLYSIHKDTLKIDAFKYIQRYFHSTNNRLQVTKGKKGCDPLHKIKYMVYVTIAGLLALSVVRMKIAINNSMIKYRGTYVLFAEDQGRQSTLLKREYCRNV